MKSVAPSGGYKFVLPLLIAGRTSLMDALKLKLNASSE